MVSHLIALRFNQSLNHQDADQAEAITHKLLSKLHIVPYYSSKHQINNLVLEQAMQEF